MSLGSSLKCSINIAHIDRTSACGDWGDRGRGPKVLSKLLLLFFDGCSVFPSFSQITLVRASQSPAVPCNRRMASDALVSSVLSGTPRTGLVRPERERGGGRAPPPRKGRALCSTAMGVMRGPRAGGGLGVGGLLLDAAGGQVGEFHGREES